MVSHSKTTKNKLINTVNEKNIEVTQENSIYFNTKHKCNVTCYGTLGEQSRIAIVRFRFSNEKTLRFPNTCTFNNCMAIDKFRCYRNIFDDLSYSEASIVIFEYVILNVVKKSLIIDLSE